MEEMDCSEGVQKVSQQDCLPYPGRSRPTPSPRRARQTRRRWRRRHRRTPPSCPSTAPVCPAAPAAPRPVPRLRLRLVARRVLLFCGVVWCVVLCCGRGGSSCRHPSHCLVLTAGGTVVHAAQPCRCSSVSVAHTQSSAPFFGWVVELPSEATASAASARACAFTACITSSTCSVMADASQERGLPRNSQNMDFHSEGKKAIEFEMLQVPTNASLRAGPAVQTQQILRGKSRAAARAWADNSAAATPARCMWS